MPYNNSPETDQIDEVRLLVGDNDETNEHLSDEEISYYIVKRGSGLPAAIGCAYALQAKFSKLADETAGDVEVKWSQRARTAMALAEKLESQLSGGGGSAIPTGIFGGGISVSDMQIRNADPNRVGGRFAVGLMDY